MNLKKNYCLIFSVQSYTNFSNIYYLIFSLKKYLFRLQELKFVFIQLILELKKIYFNKFHFKRN